MLVIRPPARCIERPGVNLPEVQMLIFGTSLIVFMIFMPQGISGVIKNCLAAIKAGKKQSPGEALGP
jgi:ABC-type branched-subunit amino acid transport system permease subunit